MRKLIMDNADLLLLLDQIEKWLGYSIPSEPMPLEHRVLAKSSISFRDSKWTLLFIPEEPLPLSMLCHELMHLVLLAEGFPLFSIAPVWPHMDVRKQIVHMLCDLVLHIEVWKLTKQIGFDEVEHYHSDSMELIKQVETGYLLSETDTNIALLGRGAYLAQGLLCPAKLGTHARLRDAASQAMPDALVIADLIVQILIKDPQPSPQSCMSAIINIFDVLQIPEEILSIEVWSTPIPNFRSSILSLYNRN